MGTEDVKVTAINMYKYKERLRFIQTLAALRLVLVRLTFVTFAVTNIFFTSEQNTLIFKSKS